MEISVIKIKVATLSPALFKQVPHIKTPKGEPIGWVKTDYCSYYLFNVEGELKSLSEMAFNEWAMVTKLDSIRADYFKNLSQIYLK